MPPFEIKKLAQLPRCLDAAKTPTNNNSKGVQLPSTKKKQKNNPSSCRTDFSFGQWSMRRCKTSEITGGRLCRAPVRHAQTGAIGSLGAGWYFDTTDLATGNSGRPNA